MKPAGEKRAEIYTYSSQDMVYAMNWSVRFLGPDTGCKPAPTPVT